MSAHHDGAQHAAEGPRLIAEQAQRLAEWGQRLAEHAQTLADDHRRVAEATRARQTAEETAQRERAMARRFAAVLEQMPAGVALAEIPGGRLLLYNAMALRLLGHPPPEPAGRPDDVSGTVHPDGSPYAPEEYPLARAVRQEETVASEEMRYRRGDGTLIDLWTTAAPIRDEDGRAVLAVATFEDISARKTIERTRDDFLSAAAHDLKTPLTGMIGYTQLARRRLKAMGTPEAATVAGYVAGIEEGIGRQRALIDELLDVARLEMGAALELARRPTDLVALVCDVVAQQGSMAERIDIVAVPELVADVDAARIERVLGNLLSNAVKYSPPGSPITVCVACEATPEGPAALIAVTDRGIGIPAADLPHIFERFHRAGNVVGHILGTGIGLASARGTVEQHGGTISAQSVEGSGSTFTVRLPLRGKNGDAPRL